jgi:cellulose biosynthesis protein BcsQ
VAKIISVFNNKGGVGKTTICWNLADALGRAGSRVLLIDFDPQCNLSIAVLGEEQFVGTLPQQNVPYGTTIRAFLQRSIQGTGGEEVFFHQGQHTSQNVYLIAGDFWLNVYADTLNVGNDLLAGTGLARYVALRRLVEAAEKASGSFDYVIVDLPPSFGSLVRAAFYASDYFIVPCTSDSFSVYCISLIGQMVPSFIQDWQTGLDRFKRSNPQFHDFDSLGRPKYAGWVFNGFDTARERRTPAEIAAGAPLGERQMMRADQTMHDRLVEAIGQLVQTLVQGVQGYGPVAQNGVPDTRIGDIEDANVLIQNSLWLHVPLGELMNHDQVVNLQDRSNWRPNQLDQIQLLRTKFDQMAANVMAICQ